MKLAYLELDGFRGYSRPLRVDFSNGFTIIDGRNGVGKSTVFDAIEFALTGDIRKHEEQKASGETIADYVWWRGDGPPPLQRFVRVEFRSGDAKFSVTRREFDGPDEGELERVELGLCDKSIAPDEPLIQLCTNAIVRDEQITKLSLDMKETDRYALLRDALGAIDSDRWIERGARLKAAMKRRVSAAEKDVADANSELTSATRRLDEIRASIVADRAMADAVSRLRKFADISAAPDELVAYAREWIASSNSRLESLRELSDAWKDTEKERARVVELSVMLESARSEYATAERALKDLAEVSDTASASSYAEQAKDLMTLASLGRKIGLRDDHCPLCASERTSAEYERGVGQAEAIAQSINEGAARAAEQENVRREASRRLEQAGNALTAAEEDYNTSAAVVQRFDDMGQSLGLQLDVSLDEINSEVTRRRKEVEQANADMRVLDTLRLSSDLDRSQQAENSARKRLARAQEKSGRTRKAQSRAQALHDAARRAASETLDIRLERVLPLMSELYRRLRPHPTWRDIEYSIRGDVRRFLSLQVGEDLNPQFLFSSGQRRATGLAFLLSVNLSLAWSKWQTIMLDDPVQHVDDFRAVNLAELLAQLVSDGRQVVCAVEDAALADLLCRRLPVDSLGDAKRLTLGPDAEGALALLSEEVLSPHMRNAVISSADEQTHTM